MFWSRFSFRRLKLPKKLIASDAPAGEQIDSSGLPSSTCSVVQPACSEHHSSGPGSDGTTPLDCIWASEVAHVKGSDPVPLLLKESGLFPDEEARPGALGIPRNALQVRVAHLSVAGSTSTGSGLISISCCARRPTLTLRHELNHLSRLIDRTALKLADQEAYEAQLLSSVLVQVGTGSRREERHTCCSSFRVGRRAVLSPTARRLVQEALTECVKGDSLKKVLAQPKFAKLPDQAPFNGSKFLLVIELRSELRHWSNVKRAADLNLDELKENPSLLQLVESRAHHWRQVRERSEGQSLRDSAFLRHLTKSASADTTGIYDKHAYYFRSREEMAARRGSLAQALRNVVSDLRKCHPANSSALRKAIKRDGAKLMRSIRRENRLERAVNQELELAGRQYRRTRLGHLCHRIGQSVRLWWHVEFR